MTTRFQSAVRWNFTTAVLLACALATSLLHVTIGAQSAAVVNQDPLPYARGFLITGNYVAGGVDLTPQTNPPDANGLSTGTISMSGVPAGANIVGAYLYWEAIYVPGANPVSGAMFRGSPIDPTNSWPNAVSGLKATSVSLLGNTATCWGAAGQNGNATLTMFRADVLNLLPKLYDKDNRWTGKRLVNSADLSSNLNLNGSPFAPHTVTLPQRTGNNAVSSAGASLVVVYQTLTDPLTKVVLYDGAYAQQTQGATMSQTLQAFYQHAGNAGKLTHLAGSGGNNQSTKLSFNGTALVTNPFPQTSPSSDRSWATFTASSLSMTKTAFADAFGETATTTVEHGKASPNDCLAWAAVVFSTPVLDSDADGLPDALESSTTAAQLNSAGGFANTGSLPWTNPDGQLLPNIHGMGAQVGHKDLLAEINAMQSSGATYGSQNAPFDSASNVTSVTLPAHSHMPAPDALKMMGDAYLSHQIYAHFDVGAVASYLGADCHFDGQNWTPHAACQYLVPTVDANSNPVARGGELITEQSCAANANPPCQFPDYPGTVAWKLGFESYRDAAVDDSGNELTTAQQLQSWKDAQSTGFQTHRTRFDAMRKSLVHYVLYAHARGKPKSLPCLINGLPAGYDINGTACTTPNPYFNAIDYHVPSSTSGVADLPGGNALITLGLWDKVLGTATPFLQASTTFHEVGHNLNLWHGGVPAILGSKAKGTSTYFEPNCNPNYFSSMSYLFQVHGLIDVNGDQHLDYSSSAENQLNEAGLADGPLSPTPQYRPTWFAPATSALATFLGVSPASRLCNGVKFNELTTPIATSMARVWTPFPSATPDWNVNVDWFGDDGTTGDANSGSENANFDGNFNGTEVLSTVLNGANDMNNLRLDQIGGGHNIVSTQGSGADNASEGADNASEGADNASEGADNAIEGADNAIEGADNAIEGADNAIEGADNASEAQEMDFGTAKDMGRTPPAAFTACVLGGTASQKGCVGSWVDNQGTQHAAQPAANDPMYHRVYMTWKVPNVDNVSVTNYSVSRAFGSQIHSLSDGVLLGTPSSTTFVDTEELPDNKSFVYWVRANFSDNSVSGVNNFVVLKGVDDAPHAVGDAYNFVTSGPATSLIVAAPGVLGNDTDDDTSPSPQAGGAGKLRVISHTNPTSGGTLTINADGSFTYTPPSGFKGTDTFTYTADDRTWPRDATVSLSAASNVATVSIVVSSQGVGGGNQPPVCGTQASSVITGGQTTIGVTASGCTDPNGDSLTITGITTQPTHGTATFTSSGMTYTSTSPYVGPDSFGFSVSDGNGGTTTGTISMSVKYGFNNVQNVPPSRSVTGGTVLAMKWQWTNAAKTALNSATAQPEVLVTAVSAPGLPAGWSGDFTPASPGTGNSFATPASANSFAWTFNWTLTYADGTGTHNLPAGTYLVRVKSNLTGQIDPSTVNKDGTTGAEVVIK